MKSTLISRTLQAVTPLVIVCGMVASATSAMAQSPAVRSQNRDCSNRTLVGNYGSVSQGMLLNIPGLPAEAQFRGITSTHFDGNGNLTWLEHTVINGTLLQAGWTPASGTYSVNPDCTGSAVVHTPNSPVPLNLSFVVVKRGTELYMVLDTDAVTSVFTKK